MTDLERADQTQGFSNPGKSSTTSPNEAQTPPGTIPDAGEALSGFAKVAALVTAVIVGVALVASPVALAGAGAFASFKGLEAIHGAVYHLGTGPVGIGNAEVVTDPETGEDVVKVRDVPTPESVARASVSAAAVVGTLILLAVVVVVLSIKRKRRTLLVAGLMLVVWLAISVILAMVDTWLSVATVTVEANILTAGQFLYAALPALPVIPLIWLLSSAAHEPEGKYETISAAAADLLKAVLKSVLTVAMWLIEFFFGVTIGVNPMAALFVGGVNALTFSMALGEAEKSRHENDRAGVHMWGLVAVMYALLAFVISAEAIITFSIDPATGVSRLSALHASPELQGAAQAVYISSLGISFALLAFMQWRRQASLLGKPPAKTARPVAQIGRNVAGGWSIKSTKAALAAGRDKARGFAGRIGDRIFGGTSTPALPAGTPAPDVFNQNKSVEEPTPVPVSSGTGETVEATAPQSTPAVSGTAPTPGEDMRPTARMTGYEAIRFSDKTVDLPRRGQVAKSTLYAPKGDGFQYRETWVGTALPEIAASEVNGIVGQGWENVATGAVDAGFKTYVFRRPTPGTDEGVKAWGRVRPK